MEFEAEKFDKDDAKRKDNPKGAISVSEDVSVNDYYRFQVNPNKRNNSYAEVEFEKGIYRVKYINDYGDETTLLESGVLTRQGDISPNYPVITWDVKGRNLLVIYYERGETKMFVYDLVAGYKKDKQTINYFDQVLDASYMLDDNTVILSAVKNGHSDIYTYKIEEREIKQITNDVYDDLNPSFISFPIV
jgi:Tol biopolymer transport system component